MLLPKLFTTLRMYSWRQFRADFLAGIIVGLVALPLAIAFAIASGLTPEAGFVTAIVAGFLVSLFGGSRVQIGGPTGAFVVIVYSIVARYGVDGLVAATFMGGIILLIFGFARFGSVIKYIPYPVTVGFTSGIAVVIFVAQIRDAFGLSMTHVPADFIERCVDYHAAASTINGWAVLICFFTIAIIWGTAKITKRMPGSLIALVVVTIAVYVCKIPVETIGSRFHEIPNMLPVPRMPHISFQMMRELLPAAFTIAILAGVESLLSAVIADSMIGGKHRSNMELVAQGIANIGSALFGGMPATGAIARTATNVHNGGRTPVAGIVHAGTFFVIMMFFGKLAAQIPLAALAGILMVIACRMAEWHSWKMIVRSPRSDIVVLCTTFFLTVFLDLTIAIQIGMVLAAFLFVRRVASATHFSIITGSFVDEEERADPNAINTRHVPHGVDVFEINGPFFFGVVSGFLEKMQLLETKPRVRILRMRHVTSIDATALNALRQVTRTAEKQGISLLLSGVHAQPLIAIERDGLLNEIGIENVFGNIDDALNRARSIVGVPIEARPEPFVSSVARERET